MRLLAASPFPSFTYSVARAFLLAIPGFAELREWARSEWDEEISFAAGRRIVNALIERSHGRLTAHAAEGLSLAEAVARLSAQPGEEKRNAPRPTTPTEAAPKRSTERGEGRAKLIAALSKHHQYADGGCLNLEPVGNNELARLAGMGPATAMRFFNKWFGGHAKYSGICRRNVSKLIDTIKAMRGEFVPANEPNYGAAPPAEHERDD